MNGDREVLRKLFGTTRDCLDEQKLSAFVHRELDSAAGAAAQRHIDGCPRCAGEAELLRSFEEAAPTPGEAADVEWIAAALRRRAAEITGVSARRETAGVVEDTGVRRRRRPLLSWAMPGLALAAAAVLLAVGLMQFQRTAAPTLPDFRPEQDVRSAALRLASPVGDLDTVPDRLVWDPPAGAATFRIGLYEVDGTEIWRGSSAQPTVELPAGIRRQIVPGRRLLWQVVAVDGDGRTIASSDRTAFRVRTTPAK